jgi:hypothetical protein
MPNFDLSDDEIEAIVNYLTVLDAKEIEDHPVTP